MSDTIFAKILRGEAPAEFVYRSEDIVAIRDIQPVAPVHLLIIPTLPIHDISEARTEHAELLGRMLLVGAELARQNGIEESGYRLNFNMGDDGGLMVPHLHLHLIGGRKLGPMG